MPEPAALGPRRLWRAVIRPLVEGASGGIVCDVDDGAITEGLLVTTQATLHAVGVNDALRELAQLYCGRVVFHPDAASAWGAVEDCRLAVLDVGRALPGHDAALIDLAERDYSAPPVLLQGLGAGRLENDSTLANLAARGWTVVELPGFEQIRLVLPAGQREFEGPMLDAILERLRSGAYPAGVDQPDARARELTNRLREAEEQLAVAEASRELAERRRLAAEDIVSALRMFNDEARADLARAHREVDDVRRLADAARADAAAARARNARLVNVQAGVREDLMRVQKSHAWRLGHWLTRAARIVTFRAPGRTDAVSRALERLDTVEPPGGNDH